LGDPEELERHLAMHQNGSIELPFVAPASTISAGAASATESTDQSETTVIVPPSISVEGFDGRFIFTQPSLDLAQSDVQLHVKHVKSSK